jgi:hypothetical protein
MTSKLSFSKEQGLSVLTPSLSPQNNHLKIAKNHAKSRYKEKKARKLTICIATLCEAHTSNPRIVFCADRLVTDIRGLTFESGVLKILQILPNCLLMNAGDSSRGDVIIKNVFDILSLKKPEELEKMEFKKIAELIQEQYLKVRDEAMELEIFKPRKMDRASFYSNMRAYPDWFSLIIDNEVRNFDFDVAFIIFGFGLNQEQKTSTGFIYQLTGDGELNLMTSTGFSIVGIGSYQSLPEITKEPYGPYSSLSDALVRTYWAKKSAERMVSVGKETTDLGIMYCEVEGDKLISKNVLASEDFKNKLLLDGFEKQKQTIKQMTSEVQKNIDEVFSGKKTINPSASK